MDSSGDADDTVVVAMFKMGSGDSGGGDQFK
jgi:hypothetical protein